VEVEVFANVEKFLMETGPKAGHVEVEVHDPFCPFCLTEVESAFHALWSCPASVAVWQERGRRLQNTVLVECEMMQLIQSLKVRTDRDAFTEAMLVLRTIWLQRNDFVFQGKFTSPGQVILKAQSLAAICTETKQEALPEKLAVEKTSSRWRAPRDGWLKVNWDAALHIQTKKMGIGVVVRNETGEVKAALAKFLPLVDDPTAAEAIAA